jgi:hypothetical protein
MEFGKIILKVFDCNLRPAAPLVPGNLEKVFIFLNCDFVRKNPFYGVICLAKKR